MVFKVKGIILWFVCIIMMSVVTCAVPVPMEQIQTAQEKSDIDISYGQTQENIDVDLNSIYFDGSGTAEDPYILSTKGNFNMAATLIISNSNYAKAYYVLSQNIDFENTALSSWGTSSQPFKGHFDGNGYKLYNVGFSDTEYYGMVAYMDYGEIKNVCIEYSPVDKSTSLTKTVSFGGIVANASTSTSGSNISIENCYAAGSVCANTSKSVYFGGIIGKAKADKADIVVKNCAAVFDFDIFSEKDSYVAGFAARLDASGSNNYLIENCASYGNFSVQSEYVLAYCGGFCAYADKEQKGWTDWVGELLSEVNNFENCISVSNVASYAPSKAYSGKFVGKIGEYVKCSNSAVANESTLTGTNKNTAVEAVLGSNFETTEYLTQNYSFDFTSKWYLSPYTKQLYPRVLLKAEGAPDTLERYSIRLDEKSGIRFYSEIENEKRGYVTEYGFIAARKDALMFENELTFDFNGKYVWGAAYRKSDNTDIVYDSNDEVTTFTGVLTGIPKIHYDKYIVLRPYLKYELDGKTEILYGKGVSASVNSVALALKNNQEAYSKLSPEEKLKLEEMLPA